MKKYTHSELVKKTRIWLFSQGAKIVITELTSAARQTPDAIGFFGSYTFLIECKASRQDFFSDKNKPCFRSKSFMGNRRYYLTPKNLIEPEFELPDGWGLLEPYGQGITEKESGDWFYKDKNWGEEMALLVSAMRRIRGILPKGMGAKIYSLPKDFREQDFRATIGILEDI